MSQKKKWSDYLFEDKQVIILKCVFLKKKSKKE